MILSGSRIVDEEPRVVPPASVQGVFTTMGCENTQVLLWDQHRERICASLRSQNARGIDALPSEDLLCELLKVNGCASMARLRLVCWWFETGDSIQVEASCAAIEMSGKCRAPLGLSLFRCADRPDPAHKVVDRFWWHEALQEARAEGKDDVLLMTENDLVLESAIANVFARFGPIVVTPPLQGRCLPGVMRGEIIEKATALGLGVEERDLRLEELLQADELWLSNATGGALRVNEVGSSSWDSWPLVRTLADRGLPAPGWRG